MRNALIILFLIMLSACSNRMIVKSSKNETVAFPEIENIQYKEFTGITYRDLIEYTLNLQNDLKQCIESLNTIQEWYKNE